MNFAEYVNELVKQKARMTELLKEKGLSILNEEKFNTLISKIPDIYQREGVTYGEKMPLFNSDTFVLEGLTFKPTRVAISCDAVLSNDVSSAKDSIFLALLNIDKLTDNETIYQLDNGQLYGGSGINVIADVNIIENNGLYDVIVSFATLNENSDIEYLFKGGELHQWVASSKDWIL